MRTGTILLVDDETDVRVLVENMLQALGYEVVAAADGEEAIERFPEVASRVRLAIVDHSMPGLDGVETIEGLRRSRPDLPAILTSGYGPSRLARAVRRARATLLTKPFVIEELDAAVRGCLGG